MRSAEGLEVGDDMTEPTFSKENLSAAAIIGLIAIWGISTGIGIIVGGFGGALIAFCMPWLALSVTTFVVNHRERERRIAIMKAKEESKS
jgi:hypothetical protein